MLEVKRREQVFVPRVVISTSRIVADCWTNMEAGGEDIVSDDNFETGSGGANCLNKSTDYIGCKLENRPHFADTIRRDLSIFILAAGM